jgi:hypothetical protein
MWIPLINESLGLLLIVTTLWLPGNETATNLRVPGTIATPIQETRFVTLGGTVDNHSWR